MQNKALSVGVLTVVVGLFSYATALRVSVWKSASSVWAESVRSTEAPFAIMRYANALFHEGHFAASANEYVRVINLVPTSFKAWRFGINSFLMAGDVVNGRKFLDASEAHVSAEKFRQLEIAFNQAAQRKGLPIRVQIPAPDSGELPSPHSGELQDTSRF